MKLLLLICNVFFISHAVVDDWKFEIVDSIQYSSNSSNEYYVVMFTADWCNSCVRYKNTKLDALNDVVDVKVIDVDKNSGTKGDKRLQRSDGTIVTVPSVKQLPTFWLCNTYDNIPVYSWTGSVEPKDVEGKLKQLAGKVQFKSPIIPWSNIVRLSSPSSKWSGIAINDNQILTCAHHESVDDIVAKFATNNGLISVNCSLIKSDRARDLSLLSYVKPESVDLQNVKIVDYYASNISGYISGEDSNTINVNTRIGSGDKILKVSMRGVKQLPLSGDNSYTEIFGMSGSPVLTINGDICGILWGGNSNDMSAVDYDTIIKFLDQMGK